MASYFIKKDDKVNKISKMYTGLHGYKFSPKNTRAKDYIDVNEVTIYNLEMIDSVLTTKFNRTFKKLVSMAQMIINEEDDDDTSSKTEMCLDEVELVRQIILNKYQDFLNYEKEELFLKKLKIIENELRVKQMMLKEKMVFLEQQEELSHGRGR